MTAVFNDTLRNAEDLAKIAEAERWIYTNKALLPKDIGPVAPGTISEPIRQKLAMIRDEMNARLMEREDVVDGALVSLVAQQHLVMIGPGGTGKSYLARVLFRHIADAHGFEAALDETSDPNDLFGPPNVKAMAELGITRRIPDGMLPCATHAFIDELMNANTPTKHALMPPLNERVFQTGGVAYPIPLRMMISGTNKLTAEPDEMAFLDRIHQLHVVDYVRDRDKQMEMVLGTVLRNSELGRGAQVTMAGDVITTVTLDELDRANKEIYSLDVPDDVAHAFFDLRDEIMYGAAGAQISDRRAGESMIAVLANAWLRGHQVVTIADLDILAHMWWNQFEQRTLVRSTVLSVTNPGESKAYDLIDEFDDALLELKNALADPDLDQMRKQASTVQAMTKVNNIHNAALAHLEESRRAGRSTTKLEEIIKRTEEYEAGVKREIFGIRK